MEAWNETVKAALLGTDRNGWSEASLPAEVKEVLANVNLEEADQEEKFMKAASLMMTYHKAGTITPALPQIVDLKAGADIRPACSKKAADLLTATIAEGRRELTALWVQTCDKNGKRIPHWLLPEVLDLGASNEHLQQHVINISDARGQWLARFNPSWKYALPLSIEETWETGKPAERSKLLAHLRKNDPGRARELMASTWKQENATLRADFIKLLAENLTREDIPFLEDQLTDKSQKVRTEAKYLLRSLPGSSINDSVWEKLKQHIGLKASKAGRSEIVVKKVSAEDKELLLAGTEKDSETTVSLKEDERWYFHMISAIDPVRWEDHLRLPARDIIDLFGEAKKTQRLLPAFSLAAHRSMNTGWAKALLEAKVMANAVLLLKMFPLSERENLYCGIMENDISVVNAAFDDDPGHQWSLDFTRFVVKLSSADAYRFRKEWYRTITLHFHKEIIKELDKYGPSDIAMKSFWQGMSQEIVQAVEIREAITHSLK
jgi:hypothetical protein